MAAKPLLFALLALTLAGAADAQWKWRDARGNVQYSDLPPPQGTPDKDILQRPPAAARAPVVVAPPGVPASAPVAAPAASAPSKAELDAAAKAKQEQAALAAKQKEDERRAAAVKRDNCSRARAGLRELQSGIRLTRTNEAGERVFVDEAQRQAEVARAQQLIASECR